jgi:uncharacterized membrane protein (UPF0127 family)
MICIKLSPVSPSAGGPGHRAPHLPRFAAPAPRKRRFAPWALALLLGIGGKAAIAQDSAQPRLPTATLTVGMHRIVAELAVTPQQQMVGMMWRTEMGASEGMLFVSEDRGVRCFWMRNTLIPLTIAFLEDDGTIVNTADMQPRSDTTHCSARPVRFALEMPQGWFERRGIKPGTRIRGGPLGN